jgi:GT2 family glycosyltransferase
VSAKDLNPVTVRSDILPAYLIHWDAPDWCASAVHSLLESRGVDVRVTVIDNGQRAGRPLTDLLGERIRVLRSERNLGYAGGANIALADWGDSFPGSELCLIGSHDLHVAPTTVRDLVRVARQKRTYGILAPAIEIPVDDSVFRSSGGVWTERGAAQLPLTGASGVEDRDWVSGTCFVIRRDCVRQIGGFDERFGSYVEDVDFCLRAKDRGWNVGVVTEAVASSLGSASRNHVGLNEANLVLLAVKRRGLKRGLVESLHVIGRGVRSLGGSVAVWRDRRRRESSRYFLTQHAQAAGTLLRRSSLIRSLARERAG